MKPYEQSVNRLSFKKIALLHKGSWKSNFLYLNKYCGPKFQVFWPSLSLFLYALTSYLGIPEKFEMLLLDPKVVNLSQKTGEDLENPLLIGFP
jgi:hypothetical protein